MIADLILLVLLVAALTYAYVLGRQHAVRKTYEALKAAQEIFSTFELDPNHRVGMLRFVQILRAQLHKREI